MNVTSSSVTHVALLAHFIINSGGRTLFTLELISVKNEALVLFFILVEVQKCTYLLMASFVLPGPRTPMKQLENF